MNKETMKQARIFREAAAKKWNCPVSEIDWPSCVAMAMRGETLEEEASSTLEVKIHYRGKTSQKNYARKVVGYCSTTGRVKYEYQDCTRDNDCNNVYRISEGLYETFEKDGAFMERKYYQNAKEVSCEAFASLVKNIA